VGVPVVVVAKVADCVNHTWLPRVRTLTLRDVKASGVWSAMSVLLGEARPPEPTTGKLESLPLRLLLVAQARSRIVVVALSTRL
jgi:hypothetical protein